jgi:hypothetical protein
MSQSRPGVTCAGGVTPTWIDDDDDKEPLEEGGGVMRAKANVPKSPCA